MIASRPGARISIQCNRDIQNLGLRNLSDGDKRSPDERSEIRDQMHHVRRSADADYAMLRLGEPDDLLGQRIMLKTGEIVTERELTQDENFFDESPAPVVGDEMTVTCRGRTFRARVVWGNWPGREAAPTNAIIPLRVEEI
jgi:hypothetical protein